MWIFIVAIIAIVIIVKTKSKSEEVVEHVAAHGGMREKYNVLVERLLSSHPNMAIIAETRTFMNIPVSRSTLFSVSRLPVTRIAALMNRSAEIPIPTAEKS